MELKYSGKNVKDFLEVLGEIRNGSPIKKLELSIVFEDGGSFNESLDRTDSFSAVHYSVKMERVLEERNANILFRFETLGRDYRKSARMQLSRRLKLLSQAKHPEGKTVDQLLLEDILIHFDTDLYEIAVTASIRLDRLQTVLAGKEKFSPTDLTGILISFPLAVEVETLISTLKVKAEEK